MMRHGSIFTTLLFGLIFFSDAHGVPTDRNVIIKIQTNLRSIGWPIVIDGIYCPETIATVRKFQEGWTFKDLIVDGDAGPLTQAEIEKCVRNGGYASKHFKFAEFKSAANGDIRVTKRLLIGLEKLRSALGKPVPIISGYRNAVHKTVLGGTKHSEHVHGTAVDISEELGASPSLVKGLDIFTGIGIKCERWVTHVDVRPGSPSSPVTWAYPC